MRKAKSRRTAQCPPGRDFRKRSRRALKCCPAQLNCSLVEQIVYPSASSSPGRPRKHQCGHGRCLVACSIATSLSKALLLSQTGLAALKVAGQPSVPVAVASFSGGGLNFSHSRTTTATETANAAPLNMQQSTSLTLQRNLTPVERLDGCSAASRCAAQHSCAWAAAQHRNSGAAYPQAVAFCRPVLQSCAASHSSKQWEGTGCSFRAPAGRPGPGMPLTAHAHHVRLSSEGL